MKFYIGLHIPAQLWRFVDDPVMLSVNIVRKRKTLVIGEWIMDSGAFSEISRFGEYRSSVLDYAKEIASWAHAGQLKAAVSQDYMCEPFILAKTGMTIAQHQALTTNRYMELLGYSLPVYIMPVIQGYTPDDYKRHLELYGSLIAPGAWVGVGSVCKRNGNPAQVLCVLDAIKAVRPDILIHGFGVKVNALKVKEVRDGLFSADSMAWSFAGRKSGGGPNNWATAKRYISHVNDILAGAYDKTDAEPIDIM